MFRKSIQRMAPYKPGEQPRPDERLIKLNTNENPYPPSPRVRRAVARAVSASLRLYPAPRGDEFVQAASRLYRVPAEMILAGNGSDELLAMIFRATVGSADTVAYPVPTYSLYDTLADVQEARVVRIATAPPSFKVPIAALARARARLTIVCNPNSPSGILTPVREIAMLARQLRGRMLVVDEAYVDFARDNAMRLLRGNPNLVILRTLSKSFSLAGMRLGLCFAHPAVISELLKVKDSYNLSRIALAAGAAALEDAAWMRRNVERVRKTRGETESELRALGFEVPPSEANFVLARLPGRDMGPVARALRRAGILVRHFSTPLLRDALRISIGKPSEMRRLVAALGNLVPAASSGAVGRKRG
jgi:histidinol-phosphate aminotransferase